MAGLTKRDVERMLAPLADPPAGLDNELRSLRGVLTDALGVVLDLPAGLGFDELAGRAAQTGAWGPERLALLLEEEPAIATRDAMWDLIAELNEHRGLTSGASATGGRSQREAVNVIERAIGALASGDADAVRAAADKIAELDVRRVHGELPRALRAAARDPSDAALDDIERALGPGPLAAEVAGFRAARGQRRPDQQS